MTALRLLNSWSSWDRLPMCRSTANPRQPWQFRRYCRIQGSASSWCVFWQVRGVPCTAAVRRLHQDHQSAAPRPRFHRTSTPSLEAQWSCPLASQRCAHTRSWRSGLGHFSFGHQLSIEKPSDLLDLCMQFAASDKAKRIECQAVGPSAAGLLQ